MNKLEIPKYEYHLCTWGGFYNKEHFEIHNRQEGDYWFDTEQERQAFIDNLRTIAEKLNAHSLMIDLTEGYFCRTRTVLHRVIEFEEKRYYSQCDLGVNYPFHAAEYHLQYKWNFGFNDYSLGEDFDYDKAIRNKSVKVISEWITGAKTLETTS